MAGNYQNDGAIMSIVIQMTHCSKIFAECQYLRSCLLLYASRTLVHYFAVAERHTEREVYSMNTLYDEMVGGIHDLDHLGNRIIHPCTTCSGRLNYQFPRRSKSRLFLFHRIIDTCSYRYLHQIQTATK